jgi:von Willebrand factor type A domain/Aerotolerance regulator N-terminal
VSFVFWAALGIVGLVVGPILAHLLRRGRAKEQEFPPAALVPALTSTARQRSHLEDYPLLALRAAMIIGLAVLGATPLVRCEKLSLTREHGASVALAIVLDDSHSMRALSPKNVSRWDLAKSGAEELLRGARAGDAVAIVLAGRPARVALAATSDLSAARRVLDELEPSDRSTDLVEAVELARSTVRPSPQKDRRVIVLSDLAGPPIREGTPPATAPLAELTKPVSDCGIASAELRGRRATVVVGCSSDAAAEQRSVELVVTERENAPAGKADAGVPAEVGTVLDRGELAHHAGEQTLSLKVGARASRLEARLTGRDDSAHDDAAPVSEEASLPLVAVVADAASASASTGGPTVVEQALLAIGDGWSVRPLPLLPDDEKGLEAYGALVVDDPRGFSPETRMALSRFLARGGVGLALVGPRATATELGLSLEPFGREAIRWEPDAKVTIATDSVAWLGPEAASLGELAQRGRARLDGSELGATRTLGKWNDGVPWIVERRAGRGLCLTVGLPASLGESDFALRPAFIALLDYVLRQADQRNGSRRTIAGTPWVFSESEKVSIDGPGGAVGVQAARSDERCSEPSGQCGEKTVVAEPATRGRYVVHSGGEVETRTVTIDPAEIVTPPRAPGPETAGASGAERTPVDASTDIALVLVALFGAEIGLRALRRLGERPPSARSAGLGPDAGDDPVAGA